jgi:hypothetical protein
MPNAVSQATHVREGCVETQLCVASQRCQASRSVVLLMKWKKSEFWHKSSQRQPALLMSDGCFARCQLCVLVSAGAAT